jgi:UDP-4-amino-4,6-dideoxy-N-acetyl-beta-L-altrosamine transaminase
MSEGPRPAKPETMRAGAAGHGFLPYGRQNLDDSDIAAVVEVLRGDWLTTGPAVPRFESQLAMRCDARHAIACSSGTAALHLACLALDLKPGDAAIVPSITFLATANAVRMTGAEAIFADVAPETGLMEPAHLEAAWRRAEAAGFKVKAVLPVHLAGQCADMAALAAMVEQLGARQPGGGEASIVEDACHALGTTHHDRQGASVPVGGNAYAAMTVMSFHPVKTVAAGEGGAVLTNDEHLAGRLARARNHGMVRLGPEMQNVAMAFDRHGEVNPWYYEMAEIGWNYRLSDIHAALALSQLQRLDHFVAERRRLAAAYDAAIDQLNGDVGLPLGRPPLIRPIERMPGCTPAWHLYAVRIDFDGLGLERAQVMHYLRDRGIGSQVHYIPVHRQPYYAPRHGGVVLNGADTYYRQTLSLPLFVGMAPSDILRVVATLAEALGHGERVSPEAAAQRVVAAQ